VLGTERRPTDGLGVAAREAESAVKSGTSVGRRRRSASRSPDSQCRRNSAAKSIRTSPQKVVKVA
jgi:hypothetical protein